MRVYAVRTRMTIAEAAIDAERTLNDLSPERFIAGHLPKQADKKKVERWRTRIVTPLSVFEGGLFRRLSTTVSSRRASPRSPATGRRRELAPAPDRRGPPTRGTLRALQP